MLTINSKYVLMTTKDVYFVEYLLDYLVLSDSITEAMIFSEFEQATKFKDMLLLKCNLHFNISTFIN
jgi:hypothetical protein